MKKSFTLNGSFNSPEPSNKRLISFIENLKTNNFQIKKVIIYTTVKKATFISSNSNYQQKVISLSVEIVLNGVIKKELAKVNDRKTPLTGKDDFFLTGRSRVNGIRYKIANSDERAILTRDEEANLGAAFIGIDVIDEKGINRGIGFHGHSNNLLEPTDGCIRMYNDDLLILAPFMVSGIKIFIL